MGFAYKLKKEIVLIDSGFKINYTLENIGKQKIITNEYVHNFLNFNNQSVGTDYQLIFPFKIMPHLFIETLNPEKKVIISNNTIGFNASPSRDFFFSNISGNKFVKAQWNLINRNQNISISETGNFKTNTINLWGVPHVICPELIYQIQVLPNETISWIRTYEVSNLN
jgi:hypothetical protein